MSAIAPDAVGAMPGLGGPGMPDPSGTPPAPGDPSSMAALAAILQGGGAGGPAPGGDPMAALGGGAPDTDAARDQSGTDLLSGMNSTEHIRAAIKHLMMAMTESTDDEESHGITKGMGALHAILAGKAKNAKAVTAAGGTPAGG